MWFSLIISQVIFGFADNQSYNQGLSGSDSTISQVIFGFLDKVL